MVIRVEVRPSQPRRRRHSTEHGMEVPVEAVAPNGRDLPEQLFKLCDVRLEVRGSGATSVLIEFGSGKNASRPSDRCVQGDPSHHESRKRRRSELRSSGLQSAGGTRRSGGTPSGALTCVPSGGRYPGGALADGGGPPPCHVRAPASSSWARPRAQRARRRSPPAARNASRARWRPASASASSVWNTGSSRSASNCGQSVSVTAGKYPRATARCR